MRLHCLSLLFGHVSIQHLERHPRLSYHKLWILALSALAMKMKSQPISTGVAPSQASIFECSFLLSHPPQWRSESSTARVRGHPYLPAARCPLLLLRPFACRAAIPRIMCPKLPPTTAKVSRRNSSTERSCFTGLRRRFTAGFHYGMAPLPSKRFFSPRKTIRFPYHLQTVTLMVNF